ncbi:MAG TPA: EF-hand domain-containing protein [Gammaproteobacteria bacterium]|nr:EF-hand domain-containing protein [Gammaproteobacteria bacterium]
MKGKAIVFGFLVSLAACSRDVAPFDELDGDHDGRISVQEAARDTALAERFAKLDTDADGELTPFEYLQYLQASNRL